MPEPFLPTEVGTRSEGFGAAHSEDKPAYPGSGARQHGGDYRRDPGAPSGV